MRAGLGKPWTAAAALALAASAKTFAAGTNVVAITPGLPEVGSSFVRMMAGLAFVLALFFGGVWVFRNWQRVARVRNRSRLNVFEARSLGPRQALYVVGYEQQRFLVAATPAGISLVSALPESSAEAAVDTTMPSVATPFAQILQNVLGRK